MINNSNICKDAMNKIIATNYKEYIKKWLFICSCR